MFPKIVLFEEVLDMILKKSKLKLYFNNSDELNSMIRKILREVSNNLNIL